MARRIKLLFRAGLSALLCCLIVLLADIRTGQAQWAERPFSYIAVDQDVRQLLRDFAASQGIGIVISDTVQGRISGEFIDVPPREFMGRIAATSGLIWYLFGGILYVYDSSENTTEVVNVVNSDPAEIHRTLRDLGILDPRYDWRVDQALGLLLLTGPPRYIELVKQVAQAVETRQASQPSVAVIRLRHASAVDRVVTYRDQQVTVPGVTSILRELAGQSGGSQIVRRFRNNSAAPLVGLADQTPTVQDAGAPTPTSSASAQVSVPAPQATSQGGQLPVVSDPLAGSDPVQIESDPRLNAVIIGARADQIPLYRQLIAELDIPTQLIQIDVSILDIATNRLTALGISWQINDLSFDSSVNDAITSGLRLATSLEGNPFDLIADVKALEQVGDARIVSQPSILTFDSVEAIIDESETIYVRVAGDQDVNLFQVQTGTLLRVTPRIVDLDSRRDIELVVEIRDGDFDQQKSVDDIPSVIESTLTTNAIVNESQGLLLGGLYRAQTTNAEDSVPVLGDIPILGWAFRSQQIQDTSVIRLFLLTPTIVELSPAQQGVVELEPLLPPPPVELTPPELPAPVVSTRVESLPAQLAASTPTSPQAVAVRAPRPLVLPLPRELAATPPDGVSCGDVLGGAVPASIDASLALQLMQCSRTWPAPDRQRTPPASLYALPGLY